MEQFELIKSDWQSEKETLEGVLVKLRSELRGKEEILSIVQAQKVIAVLRCIIFALHSYLFSV